MAMEGQRPSIGRMVHVAIHQQDKGNKPLVHRPAVIVDVTDPEEGIITVHFWPKRKDAWPHAYEMEDIGYDPEGKLDRTWHWQEGTPAFAGQGASAGEGEPAKPAPAKKKGNGKKKDKAEGEQPAGDPALTTGTGAEEASDAE